MNEVENNQRRMKQRIFYYKSKGFKNQKGKEKIKRNTTIERMQLGEVAALDLCRQRKYTLRHA